MKLKKNFIIDPVLRSTKNDDESDEKHSDWLELLFDLIFVAAISQVAIDLSDNYCLTNFLELVPLFFVIWWGWTGQTYYLDRFGTNDILIRIITMVQILVVAAIVLNIKYALSTSKAGFVIAYSILRFILVAEYLWVGKKLPEAKPLTNYYSRGFFIAGCIWFLSAFIPSPYTFITWIIALAIDILTPLTAGEIHVKFPPHPTHLPERFGLFTIIVIGETIASIVVATSQVKLDITTVFIGFMGLIISFTLWWGYFEEAMGAEERVKVRGERIAKYHLWLYSHFPLMLGIIGTAVGIKHLLYLPVYDTSYDLLILCISLVIAFMSLSLIFISSLSWKQCIDKELFIYRTPHYIIIVLIFIAGFLGKFIPGYLIIFIITVLSIINCIISLREPPEKVCKM
ncbi:MAG: low temperature requirement protein A [Methanobrevibacter sp.]|jgi:low temperature requirement protein LtrA|nr:low temperature requirement protein A [Candidatus Methanovirga basalitermitum]